MEGRRTTSMDVRGLADRALSAGSITQQNLASDTRRLASGLRVNTAADDPSGLAIAESARVPRRRSRPGRARDSEREQRADRRRGRDELDQLHLAAHARAGRRRPQRSRQHRATATTCSPSSTSYGSRSTRSRRTPPFNGRPLLDGSASSQLPLSSRAILINSDLSGGGQLIDTSIDPSTPTMPANVEQFANLVTIDSYDPVATTLNMTVTIGSQDTGAFGPDQTVTLAGSQRLEHADRPHAAVPGFADVRAIRPERVRHAGARVQHRHAHAGRRRQVAR